MLTFGTAGLIGTSGVKLIGAATEDKRTLSLITEGAQCRDVADADGRYSALSFDITVPLEGSGTEAVKIDLRGGLAKAGPSSFGLVRMQLGGGSHIFLSDAQTGNIEGRVVTAPQGASTLTISLLILASGGATAHGESLVAIDSLDLVIEP